MSLYFYKYLHYSNKKKSKRHIFNFNKKAALTKNQLFQLREIIARYKLTILDRL